MAGGIGRRALLAAPIAAAPAWAARAAPALPPRPAIASFSILGDFLGAIGGPLLAVETLVGPDADAHAFTPTPSDARKLAHARFVVLNGLGFEGWLPRLVRASGFRGTMIVASHGIPTLETADHGDARDGHEADPHLWQDPRRARAMVENIGAALAAADPDAAEAYHAGARRYGAELTALDAWVERELSPIPRARRRVVTSHDAFAYFGARYGIDFLSPEGGAARGEASAQAVARLSRQIRREGIGAIFIENQANPRVLEQVAAESGARLGGRLYADALSAPGGPAPDYVAMIRHNTRAIVEALAG